MKGAKAHRGFSCLFIISYHRAKARCKRNLPISQKSYIQMKKRSILSLLLSAFFFMPLAAQTSNTLSDQEKKEGWVLLFDGKNFDGWRKYNGTEMPAEWTIEEEAMKYQRGERAGRMLGNDLVYAKKKYSDFELTVDWKIEEKGNSGLFYYVVEVPDQRIYSSAPEVQMLDNWQAGDNKLANHLTGSLYDMLPALPSNGKPAGEWNTIVIRIKDGNATHTQNGVKVCEYSIWTPEWAELVAKSKFKDWPGFVDGPAREGFIGIQDHGYNVWIRNIKIREL